MFVDGPNIKKIFFNPKDRNDLVNEFERMFIKLNLSNSHYSLEAIKENYPNIKELFDIIRLR